jgi:hypothetical protein
VAHVTDDPTDAAADAVAKVAGIFGYLADRDFRGYSPLYEHLARHVAADRSIPARVARANPRNHAPILFFACVHDLVLRDPDGDLAADYRAVTAGAAPGQTQVWPHFQALVADHADEIDHLMRTRQVQTNEVGRASALYPALCLVGQQFEAPLALIEIGASAGLNLQLDRYHLTFRAGDGQVRVGPETSAVRLHCDVHGTRRPPLPDPEDARAPAAPVLTTRLGIDPSPVDVRDDDAVRWLRACLWPDVAQRRRRLDAAVELARPDPPEIWKGGALDLIQAAVEAVPADQVACVFSTWVLAYLSQADRLELHRRLAVLGRSRPLAWITAEYVANVSWIDVADRRPALDSGQLPTRLALEVWNGDHTSARSLAWMHAHGQWLEWIQDPIPV